MRVECDASVGTENEVFILAFFLVKALFVVFFVVLFVVFIAFFVVVFVAFFVVFFVALFVVLFVTLFVVAFPGAPVLASVSNWITIRMDCNKYLFMYRRASPTGAQDIGTWQTVFAIMSGAAVVTNGALLVFTMDTFDALPGDAMYRAVAISSMVRVIFRIFLTAFRRLIMALALAIRVVQVQTEGSADNS